MTFKPLFSVGNYEVVRELGCGGMSTVYEANDLKLKRKVAIKCLHPDLSSDPNAFERLKREALLAAQLDHPNIIRIYDFIVEKKTPYIVMEFLPGKDIEKVLQACGRLDFPTVSAIMYAIASALDEAHGLNILHRDIKPSNIMLHKSGRILLSDFGTALLQTDPRLTSINMAVGTPSYMSPEQLCHEELTPATDIYSWAVTFIVLLTGNVPYPEKEFPKVCVEIEKGNIMYDEEAMGVVPGRYREIVERCLFRDPQKRIRDGAELKELLESCGTTTMNEKKLAAIALGVAPPVVVSSPVAREVYQTRRYRDPAWRRFVIIASIAILLTTAAVAALLYLARSDNRSRIIDNQSAPSITPQVKTFDSGTALKPPAIPLSVLPERTLPRPHAAALSMKKVISRRPSAQTEKPAVRPAAPADSGKLFIYCSPWAQVTIDGKDYGKTPLDNAITLSAGPHTVRFDNQFCEPLQVGIDIAPGSIVRRKYELTIKPAYKE